MSQNFEILAQIISKKKHFEMYGENPNIIQINNSLRLEGRDV